MKFTTPCFVRVEDAEKRKELIKWMLSIGHKHVIADKCEILTYGSILQDCGNNIELFKALAAMNDENDYMQYLTDNVGNMGICTQQSPYRVVQMAGISFNIDNYRKATAQEIIEHFNRKQI